MNIEIDPSEGSLILRLSLIDQEIFSISNKNLEQT